MAFDATLKEFFQQLPTSLLAELTGGVPVREFLNVELPAVQERRLDLVLRLVDETLLHIELQSSNDRDMPLRMLEYYTLLWRRYRKPVRQAVVYVGTPRLRMERHLESASLRFDYELRDIREWRAEDLLASSYPGDQVLAILGETDDARGTVRTVLTRIENMAPNRRGRALRYVLNLAGLRRFGIIVSQEAALMGVTIDWTQYPAVREAAARAAAEGEAKGEAMGEARGVRRSLLVLLEKRFGTVPVWAQRKVEKAPVDQALTWLAAASDAKKITDLIPRR